jgi:hypothetical protein
MPFILPIRAWLVRIPKVVNRNVNIPSSTQRQFMKGF